MCISYPDRAIQMNFSNLYRTERVYQVLITGVAMMGINFGKIPQVLINYTGE